MQKKLDNENPNHDTLGLKKVTDALTIIKRQYEISDNNLEVARLEDRIDILCALVRDAVDAMRWVHDNPDIDAFLNRPEVRAVMKGK